MTSTCFNAAFSILSAHTAGMSTCQEQRRTGGLSAELIIKQIQSSKSSWKLWAPSEPGGQQLMRRSERSSSARRCMLRHPWCPWNQRGGASLVHVHVRACVWNPKGSTYLYQGYTKLSRTNSNTCRGARKPLISIQTCIEKRIVAWSGWRLPRRQKRPPSNEPSGPTTAGGSQAAESAFKQEHTWLLPRPPHRPWIGEGSEVTAPNTNPSASPGVLHDGLWRASVGSHTDGVCTWSSHRRRSCCPEETAPDPAAVGGDAVRTSLRRTQHTSGRRSYFVRWFDGEEDVREKRLRPDGAVERDHAGQERPEHHQDVEVAASWMKALP